MATSKEALLLSSKTKELHLIDEKEAQNKVLLGKCNRYVNSPELVPEQRQVLSEYLNYMKANRGKITSYRTISNNMIHLYLAGKSIKKPFDQYTRKDLENYFANIKHGRVKEDKELCFSTITYKSMVIKQFFQWLYQTEGYPEQVSWLHIVMPKRQLDPSELITLKEINNMVAIADNLRDKCLIMMLYESGFRVAELYNLDLKDVKIGDHFVEVTCNGKTGKRTVYLCYSEPYIREHVNNHPFSNDPNAPFFINMSHRYYSRRLLYSGVLSMVKLVAKKAKIKKPRMSPHLFRHSRATELASLGWTEPQLRQYFGWKLNSQTPTIYVHFGQGDLKKKILQMNGLMKDSETIRDAEEREKLRPKTCPRCNSSNPSTASYCNCGMALDLKIVIEDIKKREETDSNMNELFGDPEFKKMLKNYMKKKESLGVPQ